MADEIAEAIDTPAPDTETGKAPAPKEPAKAKEPSTVRESVEKAFAEAEVKGKKEADPDFDEYGVKDGEPAKKDAKAKGDDSKKAADPLKDDPKAKEKPEDKRTAKEDDADDDDDDQGDDLDASDDDDDDDDKAFNKPPQRFSDDAKKTWADAPLPVRAEVNRALTEMEKGIEKYKGVAEDYEEFKEFHGVLKANGQKFQDVLGHYVGMETMLKRNPVQGFQMIANNMGTSLEQIASYVLRQPLDQRTNQYLGQIKRMQGVVQQLQHQNQQLVQRFETQNLTKAERELEEFAEGHERMAESDVQEEMAFFYTSGKAETLEEAYDMAVALIDGVKSGKLRATGKNGSPTAHTQKGKSLSGAPRSGSNPKSKGGKVPSVSDALKSRMREAGI